MRADLKKRAIHRSRILQGQLKGLEKMIEQEEYCMDILTQNLAIQKSIGSLNKLIVENHLTTHIKDGMNSSSTDTQEQSMKELLSLYELNNLRSTT